MKIIYRDPTVLEQMSKAVRETNKPIAAFELTQSEFERHYSSFDRQEIRTGTSIYSYKGIPIKVINNED